jgi:hypothetical protein
MKRKYRIYPLDRPLTIGETMATSAAEAVRNYWWTNCKKGDPFAYTEYKPTDFEAVAVRRGAIW